MTEIAPAWSDDRWHVTARAARRRVRRLRARSRLRAINGRRALAARRRPIPSPPVAPRVSADVSYGAPRTLLFVTVKRDNSGWRDLYGHWWVEVDAEESYGWWPARVPLGVRDLLRGCGGTLNGMGLVGRGATWFRDSAHGREAAHAFHPVLIEPLSDDEVRRRIRRFAHSYDGQWRWAWHPRGRRDTCRSFQDDLLIAAGLAEGIEHLPSRGRGCPFLFRPRTLLWAAQDALEGLARSSVPTSASDPTAERSACPIHPGSMLAP